MITSSIWVLSLWPMVALFQETVPAGAVKAESGADGRVEKVLSDLETVGATVRDLRCALKYKVVDTLNFEEYTKDGEIIYKEGAPNPMFHIRFDRREQGGVLSRDREWWLFDGRWLWEVNESAGQALKREIVGPGEKVDLFNIETAPFPVPFGQKKDEILKHFVVTLEPAKAGDPPNTDHLRCVPKPGSRLAEDYDLLEFYILKDLHLPGRIVATERQGYKIIVSDFPDLARERINTGVKAGEFEPLEEWKKFGSPVVEPLKGGENAAR